MGRTSLAACEKVRRNFCKNTQFTRLTRFTSQKRIFESSYPVRAHHITWSSSKYSRFLCRSATPPALNLVQEADGPLGINPSPCIQPSRNPRAKHQQEPLMVWLWHTCSPASSEFAFDFKRYALDGNTGRTASHLHQAITLVDWSSCCFGLLTVFPVPPPCPVHPTNSPTRPAAPSATLPAAFALGGALLFWISFWRKPDCQHLASQTGYS